MCVVKFTIYLLVFTGSSYNSVGNLVAVRFQAMKKIALLSEMWKVEVAVAALAAVGFGYDFRCVRLVATKNNGEKTAIFHVI